MPYSNNRRQSKCNELAHFSGSARGGIAIETWRSFAFFAVQEGNRRMRIKSAASTFCVVAPIAERKRGPPDPLYLSSQPLYVDRPRGRILPLMSHCVGVATLVPDLDF
jgi:hypothetical protein